MIRLIKFRGMGVDGTFHYGNLGIIEKRMDHIQPGSYISNSAGAPFAYQVRPETVGEFTGLKDKKGKEIYEGDIIKGLRRHINHAKSEPTYTEIIFEVKWNIEKCAFEIYYSQMNWSVILGFMQDSPYEIIGNVFQNSDLLKK